jgi:CubicO group peptidase (beta-lactamase class C family)
MENRDPESKRMEMVDRASGLELNYNFEIPPGDVLSHHAAGYAKIMCSAVFITGLDPEFAMENVGYFTAPYEERSRLGSPLVDYEKKTVSVTIPGGVTRTAVYTGDQGCVCLPEGIDTLFFKPVEVERTLPDPETTPWPMGDKTEPFPPFPEIDMEKVSQAVNAAFNPEETNTAAFLVTYRGKIIGERYADGINKYTPLESWSMGKSLTATLLGILINEGVYTLDQPAPVPQWQKEGDARSAIRIMDILHMSSGLHCRAPQDPDYDASLGYPDHLYLYTGGMNTFEWAAARPQQWPPNTVGRYRNVDPVLVNYLIRLGVEGRGENYHTFPQKALFDKIGIRTMILETDSYGNFLTQGYELASARDWARLGNLYLQDGIWNEERILPEGFTDFVRTPAPAWLADGRPVYGGFFWINGDGARPVPEDSYMMLGAGGQSVTIIPSHDMVIVRLGHYNGQEAGVEALNHAYHLMMEAVHGKDR